MKNFKVIGSVDTTLLLAQVEQANLWKEDSYLRDAPQGPFGDTETIICRFPPRAVLETVEALKDYNQRVDEHENINLAPWYALSEVRRHTLDLARALEATRIGRVLINRIQPGGRIFPHADTESHSNYWARLHITIHSMPGVKFRCEDETIEPLTGDVFYFDNRLEHEVINESTDPRLSMVVDLKIQEIR